MGHDRCVSPPKYAVNVQRQRGERRTDGITVILNRFNLKIGLCKNAADNVDTNC